MQTLIKNTRAYKLLRAERDKGRLKHAYLVLFDDANNLRGCLKSFAKLLFDCDKAPTSRISDLIDAEAFSDCLFYPASGEKFVVEDAEKLTEESALQAVEGEKKVFVVCDFAEATPASQNKLLKLLEEPPEGVVFLLGATTAFPVLSTVLSRVEKLEISPFDVAQVKACLTRLYADKQTYTQADFELCAAASGGCVGRAQSLLEGGDFQALLEDAFALCLGQSHELPVLIKKIGETKRKKEFLSLLRILFRDTLILRANLQKSALFLQGEKDKLEKMATVYSSAALLSAQELLLAAEQQLFFNTVFPQCIEVLFARIYALREKKS